MSDKPSNSKTVNDKDLDDLLNSEYKFCAPIGCEMLNANYVI